MGLIQCGSFMRHIHLRILKAINVSAVMWLTQCGRRCLLNKPHNCDGAYSANNHVLSKPLNGDDADLISDRLLTKHREL